MNQKTVASLLLLILVASGAQLLAERVRSRKTQKKNILSYGKKSVSHTSHVSKPVEKKTKFLLVRHGQTDWNVKHRMQGFADIPLNDHGRKEAKVVAERLCHLKDTVTAVYASDLERAAHTAQEIACKMGKYVCHKSDLRELHVGKAQGLTPEERDVQCGKWRKDLETRYPSQELRWAHPEWPEGESKNDLLKRVTNCLREIAKKHPGEEVVVVTHAGVIYTLIESITQQTYQVPNCCVAHFTYDPSSTQSFGFDKIETLESQEAAAPQKSVNVQL